MIIAVTDRTLCGSEQAFQKQVLTLINSTVDFVVLREKDWSSDKMVSFLLELMGQSDLTCRKIIVHSQVETARHLGLTYVHLPESRLDEIQKSHTKYSYSVHDVAGLKSLADKPSMFVFLSPVGPTSCKPEAAPLSEEVLKAALSEKHINLVALGGVTLENAPQLKQLGFKHIALRSPLMQSENPQAIIDLYKAMGF